MTHMLQIKCELTFWQASAQRLLALVVIVLMLPVFALNGLLAKAQGKPVFYTGHVCDCVGRAYKMRRFSTGFSPQSARLFDLLALDLAWFGLPSKAVLKLTDNTYKLGILSSGLGIFSSVYPAYLSGMPKRYLVQKLNGQMTLSFTQKCMVAVTCIIAVLCYGRGRLALKTPASFRLYNIAIDNTTLESAAAWVTQTSNQKSRCKIGCFVNVNSINLAAQHAQLLPALQQANKCFADGSGMRIAARHGGVNIKENVNGTDLLPLICQRAVQKNKTLYLLGGTDTVVRTAALDLPKQFPGLRIAGYHHGFFDPSHNEQVIGDINASKADIVLVAMGSPKQEAWLSNNADALHCNVGLAVGGLFDFVSGQFSRAPRQLRELGLEWVWRLMEDPKTKFYRYVIGNPIFLFNTLLLNKANVEVLS